MRGNVIFGTRRYVSPYALTSSVCGPTGATDVFAATTNAWYNFTGGISGFNYTDATYGNFNTVTADWFMDQAAGDYRLQRLPAVQEKGGPVKDWMGSGRRVGPKDMGDGTMTVEPYDKYGVRIVRNNALPRLKNFPEPGCFELWWPKGVGISFK